MLTLRRQKRHSPHRILPSICVLLSIQPIRRRVLQYVSAFDAAKLNLLRLLTLTSRERETYLRPIRNLVWDVDEKEVLSREGMRLVLLGDAVRILEQRLSKPGRYQAAQGARRLSVYLIGTFPILPRSPEALERLTSFSVFGESSPGRALDDERHVRRIQWAMQPGELKTFLMAFGVAAAPCSGEARGAWHGMPDVPDRTIDARVYIPTFYDRWREEVRITSRDLFHILRPGGPSHLQLRRAPEPAQWAHATHRLCKVATGKSTLTAGALMEQGEASVRGAFIHLNVLLDMGICSRLVCLGRQALATSAQLLVVDLVVVLVSRFSYGHGCRALVQVCGHDKSSPLQWPCSYERLALPPSTSNFWAECVILGLY